MQFPTKDEEFKRRLLKGGARMVEAVKSGDKSSGRDKDRSKDKDKERRERDRDKDKDRKEKRDSDKYREREKEKQREKERMKEKLGVEEKPKPAKPKSDFTELFGTPIKKETKKEKEEKDIKKETQQYPYKLNFTFSFKKVELFISFLYQAYCNAY